MIDHDRRQQNLLREAEQDVELEEMVARLVKEFERDMAERERKAREALEAAAQITDEDRARMEAEAIAEAEAEARAREEAAAAAQAEAEEVLAMIAAERAAQAARQAAIEAEEARRFHEALKKKPLRRRLEEGELALTEAPLRACRRPRRAARPDDDRIPGRNGSESLTGRARRIPSVQRRPAPRPWSCPAAFRPPRPLAADAPIRAPAPTGGQWGTGAGRAADAARSCGARLFGGRLALSVGGKGAKT
jgi:pyruvate/2-oxoglutarate dehydrogenase complex dihydrolipoamide acyltransferase (E2) component